MQHSHSGLRFPMSSGHGRHVCPCCTADLKVRTGRDAGHPGTETSRTSSAVGRPPLPNSPSPPWSQGAPWRLLTCRREPRQQGWTYPSSPHWLRLFPLRTQTRFWPTGIWKVKASRTRGQTLLPYPSRDLLTNTCVCYWRVRRVHSYLTSDLMTHSKILPVLFLMHWLECWSSISLDGKEHG